MRGEEQGGRRVIDPVEYWSFVTDAPLKGLALARESASILAWDEASTLYLLNADGELLNRRRTPTEIISAAISDDGSLAVVVVQGPRLWLLNKGLEPKHERSAVSDAANIAVDSLGRYIAVATKGRQIQLYTRDGQLAGKAELLQPATHICFIASKPVLLTCGAYGQMTALDLEPRSGGKLEPSVLWNETLLTNVGGLAATGDMEMILASCHTHGIQRYTSEGKNEGSYHIGGSASFAVPDFSGRRIVVATGESELVVLNRSGNVHWKTGLKRPVAALQVDALGRYVLYASSEGEITRLDLEPNPRAVERAKIDAKPNPKTSGKASDRQSSSVRAGFGEPAWSIPLVNHDDEALTMVLIVQDDPPCIGVAGRDNRLRVFDVNAEELGQAPDILGPGRFLRCEPGWIAIATDRQISLYDTRHGKVKRLDLSMIEITHLELGLDSFGLGVIQERDRLGRASLSGRWIWKREINSPVEDAAIGPAGIFAVTTEQGKLLIYDASGEPAGSFQTDPPEPLCLAPSPSKSSPGVCWITLARNLQVVRGHALDGSVLWESPVPWESWKFSRLGRLLVVSAPDGRAIAFDGSGEEVDRGKACEEPYQFGVAPGGGVVRVQMRDNQCICSELGGQVLWRLAGACTHRPLCSGSQRSRRDGR